ncbi:unnamed protein product [Knipowitschia caucasica]
MATEVVDMRLEAPQSKGPERRRQGKFQPFKRLFGKKKKKESKAGFDGADLKSSSSTGEVCNGVVSEDEDAALHLREVNSVGARALSHDSIFIPEPTSTQEDAHGELTMSHENVSDKVRNLQRQIASNIKFGQKLPSMRRSEGDEGSTDDDEAPRSPMKVQVQAQVQTQVQTQAYTPDEAELLKPESDLPASPLSAPHSSPPAKSPRSKRVLPTTGTIESINLDAVPQSGPRLDNTAAKHKLSVKPKNQRVSRKHQRFTQDLEEVSIPGVLEEDPEPSDSVRRRQHEEEARKRREEEETTRAEEERKRAEEQRARELEVERRRREEEEEERLLREAEERRVKEELLRKQREEEEQKHREEERKKREEEERRRREEEEERRRREEEEERRRGEEEEERRKRREEEEERRKQQEELEKQLREEEEQRRREEERKKQDEEERKRREEELRWREMEERQKPFSFKVSSGEKQILFQKVNLTPVTPGSTHHQGDVVVDHKESPKAASSEDTSNLSPSTYIPHTAILVTGAQLCGPAVNLDQIKDTACKSLLGLEEKKTPGPMKNKTSPDRKSGKTKSLSEASFSTDQPPGLDVLAEWASIRSKIFKGVEDGSYPDPEMTKCQPPPEEQPAFSHTHLRKTMSANAKFSITPAKKKFGDSNRNSEVFSPEDVSQEPNECPVSPAPKPKGKSVRIVERVSDECVFAKDLPSFLVPGAKSDVEMLKTRTYSESYDSKDLEEDLNQCGEDAPSPFGIKLRRTNFSLRFHNEQSTEKRKKRYSDGDNFEGIPSPLTPIEPDVSNILTERASPMSPQKECIIGKYIHSPRTKPAKSPSPTPQSESEKIVSKPPVYRRPATSPKPPGSVPTPPPSPLPKVHRGTHSPREFVVESTSQEQVGGQAEEAQRCGQGHSPGEEEHKEKKSFFPSISIPWREKTDRKTELIRKDKPSLQSRHSLDSAKVQEKEGAPMWIHVALQKQKGFREQQQNREDRRSLREAKMAEKHVKDRDSLSLVIPSDSRGSGSSSPSSKPQTPEEKRPDSLLGRLDRREQLKKASTLPSSVTVEIADSTPSPPAVKDVSKRFPSSDSAQVSTEPAWLALAKRKAKAWSDCPQIIK